MPLSDKMVDRLLAAAQAVVNDATAATMPSREEEVYTVDMAIMDDLKGIVQEISNEAVREINEQITRDKANQCRVLSCPNGRATSYAYCAVHQQQRFRAEDHGETFVVDGQCHSAACRGECGTHPDPFA